MKPKFVRRATFCVCMFVSGAAMAQGFGGGGDFGGSDFGGSDFGGGSGVGDIGSVGDIGDIGDIAGAVESGLSAQGIDVDLDALADLAKANLSELTDLTAALISQQISEDRGFCSAVLRDYQIACIADRFGALANQLPRSGDYRQIRQGLRDASRDLDRVAKANADARAPKKRFRAGTGASATRTGRLTQVNPARRAEAEAKAAAVIDELQNVLLRSGEAARERQVLYQDIASAVGSNKLLLRS